MQLFQPLPKLWLQQFRAAGATLAKLSPAQQRQDNLYLLLLEKSYRTGSPDSTRAAL